MNYFYFFFFLWLTTVITSRKGWPIIGGIVFAIFLQWIGQWGLFISALLLVRFDLSWFGAALVLWSPILKGIFAMGIAFMVPRTQLNARQYKQNHVATMPCSTCGRENAITTKICPQCGHRRAADEIVELDRLGKPVVRKLPSQSI